MKITIGRPNGKSLWLAILVVSAMLSGGVRNAVAQPGRGFTPMDPEKQSAAWALESRSVAAELGITQEPAEKLAAAYASVRASHSERVAKIRAEAEEGDRFGMFQSMMEANEDSADDLANKLGEILEAKQVTIAMSSLGTFSRGWDRMADTLSGLELSDENLASALSVVLAYTVTMGEAREDAMASMDFQLMREVREEAKPELDAALAKILSEEQLAKWNEATTFRRGFRGGRGG